MNKFGFRTLVPAGILAAGLLCFCAVDLIWILSGGGWDLSGRMAAAFVLPLLLLVLYLVAMRLNRRIPALATGIGAALYLIPCCFLKFTVWPVITPFFLGSNLNGDIRSLIYCTRGLYDVQKATPLELTSYSLGIAGGLLVIAGLVSVVACCVSVVFAHPAVSKKASGSRYRFRRADLPAIIAFGAGALLVFSFALWPERALYSYYDSPMPFYENTMTWQKWCGLGLLLVAAVFYLAANRLRSRGGKACCSLPCIVYFAVTLYPNVAAFFGAGRIGHWSLTGIFPGGAVGDGVFNLRYMLKEMAAHTSYPTLSPNPLALVWSIAVGLIVLTALGIQAWRSLQRIAEVLPEKLKTPSRRRWVRLLPAMMVLPAIAAEAFSCIMKCQFDRGLGNRMIPILLANQLPSYFLLVGLAILFCIAAGMKSRAAFTVAAWLFGAFLMLVCVINVEGIRPDHFSQDITQYQGCFLRISIDIFIGIFHPPFYSQQPVEQQVIEYGLTAAAQLFSLAAALWMFLVGLFRAALRFCRTKQDKESQPCGV
ncbi:MAG: hypothetical protein ACOX6U_09735 [Oscillospiraceae bacterium]|jgi:hypothetical protein